MKRYTKKINLLLIKTRSILLRRDGFGMNEILGIAAGLILAAFIIIPGLKGVSEKIMDGLDAWWTNTIVKVLFPTSI